MEFACTAKTISACVTVIEQQWNEVKFLIAGPWLTLTNQSQPAGCMRASRPRHRFIGIESWMQARGFVASLEAGSSNAADAGLVRSVMAAGFYPLVRA